MSSLHEVHKALEEMRIEIASTVLATFATSEVCKEALFKAVGERIAETIVKQNDLTK